jgi:hypothetical protein
MGLIAEEEEPLASLAPAPVEEEARADDEGGGADLPTGSPKWRARAARSSGVMTSAVEGGP